MSSPLEYSNSSIYALDQYLSYPIKVLRFYLACDFNFIPSYVLLFEFIIGVRATFVLWTI